MSFSSNQTDISTGILCNFWTLIEVNVNDFNKICHLVIGGWVDQAHHDAGNAPLMQQVYDLFGPNYPFPDGNPVRSALIGQFEALAQTLAPFKPIVSNG